MPARPKNTAPPEEPAGDGQDSGGLFRNTGAVPVTVLSDIAVVLGPGRIARFDRTPTHRDLATASEADFAAQQAVDDAARTSTDDADTAESAEKTEA